LLMYKTMFGLEASGAIEFSFSYYFSNKVAFTLALAIFGSAPVVARALDKYCDKGACLVAKRGVALALLALCILNAVSGLYSPFIYFRF